MRRLLVTAAIWSALTGAAFAQAAANCVVVNGVSQCANGIVFNGGITVSAGQSITFGTDTTISRAAAGKITLTGTTPMIQFGGTTSSFPALRRNGASAVLEARLADDSAYANFTALNNNFTNGIFVGGTTLVMSATAPTISSGFGTSPSVASNNGTAGFRVNVGTGGVATSGVVSLPAATTGWNCQVTDMTNNTVTRETASTTTTVTVTAASAWAASDILIFTCAAY